VPVTALHLISRYTGADAEHAPLHRLGADQWEKAKRQAAEKAYDVAAELLDIYARRAAATATGSRTRRRLPALRGTLPVRGDAGPAARHRRGHRRPLLGAPMDRLVCGDVGFGKTEVAMRAAFVAVQSGKQVAVLVPTTLLAQQHHETFRDRFADWPVRIEWCHGLRSDSESRHGRRPAAGRPIDIVDRHPQDARTECRLPAIWAWSSSTRSTGSGCARRNSCEALRAEVDVLTLTATPIPRTLNMALSGCAISPSSPPRPRGACRSRPSSSNGGAG
jgi:transcription-repair coupling factor (superfamily II helicase)